MHTDLQITNDNIEQVLETIGKEVNGLSKEEFNDEENNYFESLFKQGKTQLYKQSKNQIYGYKMI